MDDATHFTHLHLMCTKDEVFTHYKTFEAWATTQLDVQAVLHALDGSTPYQAVFKRKPNLFKIREWGKTAWVRIEGDGDKLKGQVKKGCWIGIDEAIEGENEGGGVTPIVINLESATPDAQDKPKAPTVPLPLPPDDRKPHIDEPVDMPETPQHLEAKASQPEAPVSHDLLDGKGTYTHCRNAPKLPPGVPMPDPKPDPPEKEVFEEEGSAAWMMEVEDEVALVVEMSQIKGLEPQMYNEVKKQPDWPL
ncbi:hypothetical protein BDN71DRAFT_1431750 [Pleurotus eryngii]|uniref:Uncharacterized protein n=1 Tax=Pleurotus eryngii TaxID=5323 RepID=A0A9P5ZX96_PLEER|nr:hypothetical protein BDN71DRAFT_1431750 [Pleurotus eryngii]